MNLKYAIVMLGVPIAVHGESIRAAHKDEETAGRLLMKFPEGPEKWDAAQKRQYQRDFRRRFTNPYRTQAEEMRERERKHVQGEITSRTRDPYNREYGDH
eukprot:411042_1